MRKSESAVAGNQSRTEIASFCPTWLKKSRNPFDFFMMLRNAFYQPGSSGLTSWKAEIDSIFFHLRSSASSAVKSPRFVILSCFDPLGSLCGLCVIPFLRPAWWCDKPWRRTIIFFVIFVSFCKFSSPSTMYLLAALPSV